LPIKGETTGRRDNGVASSLCLDHPVTAATLQSAHPQSHEKEGTEANEANEEHAPLRFLRVLLFKSAIRNPQSAMDPDACFGLALLTVPSCLTPAI
jgi:hypothetical protein